MSNKRPPLTAAGGWVRRPGLGDLGGAPLSLLPSGLATENNTSNCHILSCEAMKWNGLHVGRRIISTIAIDIECYERTIINNASFSWLRVWLYLCYFNINPGIESRTFSVPGSHFDYMLRSILRHMWTDKQDKWHDEINPLVDGKRGPVLFPVWAPRNDSQAGALRHWKQTADPGALDAIASLSHKPGECLLGWSQVLFCWEPSLILIVSYHLFVIWRLYRGRKGFIEMSRLWSHCCLL